MARWSICIEFGSMTLNISALNALQCFCAALFCSFLLMAPPASAGWSSDDLVAAAKQRTLRSITYDGSYFSIAYPGGDVPEHIGVCTDVVIRSYRETGVDLQQLVHEDMRRAFDAYPSTRIWGLTKPDPNIDHRRVPNLRAFLTRNGVSLTPSRQSNDYLPGDLVTWMLPGNLPHIGIVSDVLSDDAVPLVVHNIGEGPKLENILFRFKITGHYRYSPRPSIASDVSGDLTASPTMDD